jgi:hypothetical protein
MLPRDLLRCYPLLAALDPRWLDGWLASGVSRSLDLGEPLFQAGTPDESLFMRKQRRRDPFSG